MFAIMSIVSLQQSVLLALQLSVLLALQQLVLLTLQTISIVSFPAIIIVCYTSSTWIVSNTMHLIWCLNMLKMIIQTYF